MSTSNVSHTSIPFTSSSQILIKTFRHWGEGFNNVGHYIGAYDAGYYGYMYSEVFSADMYYTSFKADPLNSEQGRRYRHIILERGGSRPEMDLLKEFLGREPNSDAFFKDLGLA